MGGLHFISYSQHGREFADWLYAALWKADNEFQPWMDRHDLTASHRDQTQLEYAIARCESFLYVLSRDALDDRGCRNQLDWALQLAKQILVLRIDDKVDWTVPGGVLAVLDFISNWPAGLDPLQQHLRELTSRRGLLQQEKMKLLRKEWELQSAEAADRTIIERKVAAIQMEIEDLEVAEQPTTGQSGGQAGPDVEGAHPVQARAAAYVNGRPAKLPVQPEFQDRRDLLESLRLYLQDDEVRVVSVTGVEGIGKTRLVGEALAELTGARAATGVDAVVPLSAHPLRPVSAAHVVEELRSRFPSDLAGARDGSLAEPDLPLPQKVDRLVAWMAGRRVVVAIDAVESLLDAQTGHLRQGDLDELLRLLVTRGDHRITVVLVSRVRPTPLLRELRKVREVHIRVGLPRDESRYLLRSLDPDNSYGFRDAELTTLDEAWALTGGYPGVLEALFGNLTLPDSPYTSLAQLLEAAAGISSNDALEFLVGQMFRHLDPSAWSVAQALAIYGQPVSRAAIEELLEPYIGDHPIRSALDRLVRAHLVRQEGGWFYLPPPNDSRAFELIPKGAPADRDLERPPFTRYALLHRAADILGRGQAPNPRAIEELSPRLSQIDLLIKGEESEAALRLIDEIDGLYLERWGYSHVLARQRMTLRETLQDELHRLVNLNALGQIYERNTDLVTAAEVYEDALTIAKRLNRVDGEKKLYVNLAGVQLARGWLHDAFDYYTRALGMAREHGQVAEQATPLAGLAECFAHTGAFPQALEHAEEALAIARAHALPDLGVWLLWMIGRWRGQLGETVTALDHLYSALALARERDNHRVEAKLLDAIAEVLIDQGRLARAATLAEKATEIGKKLHSPTLRREAGFTLALARLCMGDLNAAEAAAEQACAYRRPGQAPFLLALRGIIVLQQGDRKRADDLFTATLGEVDTRRENASHGRDHDFALLDLQGIAHCGLALSRGRQDYVDKAARAFRQARGITRAPGIVTRSVRLVCELEDDGRLGELTPAVKAASGEREPAVKPSSPGYDWWSAGLWSRAHRKR